VFDTEVEAVALLAVGSVFLLVGLTGVAPTRLKTSDAESAMRREVGGTVGGAMATMVGPETPEARREVAASFRRLATDAPEISSQAIAGLTYGQRVSEVIMLVALQDPQIALVE
jgi:hypothetical protein